MIVGATLLGVAGLILWRFLLGYPKTDHRMLRGGEAAFLQAAAESFFPPDEGMPISGAEADLPGYADEYLLALPSRQRGLLRALFLLFEHATLLWPAPGARGFRRFSGLSERQRLAVLRGWQTSRFGLRRMCFSALKAVLILGYVGHPRCLEALDLSPWEIESPIREADLLYAPIGKGPDEIPYRPSDLSEPGPAPPLRMNPGEEAG